MFSSMYVSISMSTFCNMNFDEGPMANERKLNVSPFVNKQILLLLCPESTSRVTATNHRQREACVFSYIDILQAINVSQIL